MVSVPPTPSQALVSERLRGVRRIAIIVIIVSVSIAAAVGIVTVVTGDFGETQNRVFWTTALVAGLSIAALCHLAIIGRQIRVVGFLGLAAGLAALATGTLLIWANWSDYSAEFQSAVVKVFAVAGALAVFLAQSNLLLLLSSRRRRTIRLSLYVTLAAISVVYVLITALILTDGDIASRFTDDLYVRVLAVVAIIDALGTVLLPVLAVFIRDSLTGHVKVTLNLPAESASILAQWTADSGQSPEEVVAALLVLGRKVESE